MLEAGLENPSNTEEQINMDKNQLHQELERLHTDLQQIKSPDKGDREILSRLEQDIRRILEYEEPDSGQYQNLSDRLKDAITRFEASHPRTTLAMRQVIDQIGYLGI